MERRTRINQVGRIGKIKIADKQKHKTGYCKTHGEKKEDAWWGRCQSCWQWHPTGRADFAHKKSAGSGGDIGGRVQATNGIYCCRRCHDFHENDAEARAELLASPANCATGGRVKWTRATAMRLANFKRAIQ